MNHFLLPKEEYKRDLDIVSAYVKDIALYLCLMTGDNYEQCLSYVARGISPNGCFPLKDPDIRYLERDKNGDRHVMEGKFTYFLKDVVEKERIISPSMAVYENPKVKKSILAIYIQGNLTKRKKFKHAMFVNEMEGKMAMYMYFDVLQNSTKIKNNSLSGAHASPFTILYNKSSHSSLTSLCRAATSYGNTHNEKFIMGNRHYWNADIVIANILHITRTTDYVALQEAMDFYQFHYPTVEETVNCIYYSARLYWRSDEGMRMIADLVNKLNPIQRAAFVYLGDMYHLAKYNDRQVREFLSDLMLVATVPHPEPDKILDKMSSDMKAFVMLLCSDFTAGKLLKDIKADSPHDYGLVAATAEMVDKTLDKHKRLIIGLWRTNTAPSSIAKVESMVRRCVVVSDTDSTIFTNQYWSKWFVGKIDFSKTSFSVAYSMTYLTSQVVAHLLAKMCANIGVATEQIHQIAMKNEFFFPIFTQTPRAKHYFAFKSACEGNVYKKMKMEIKGVEMRSSNAPPEVMQYLDVYMQDMMNKLMKNGELTLDDVVGPVARTELQIIKDIQNGGFKYMRLMQIKDADAYVDGESAAPFKHYQLWEEVFAPKYGTVGKPPFPVVKISMDLKKKKLVEQWLINMPDQELAERMRGWMQSNGSDSVTAFMFPLELLELHGIPKEIIPAIDLRELIYNVMSPFYLVLESMGFYMINKNLTRLVSDDYRVACD